MKNKLFLAMTTLALLATGCNNNDFEGNGLLSGNTTIKATMEQKDDTRSLVDDNSGKFTWATGDKISVLTSANENRIFTLTTGEETDQGTFNGTLVDDETMTYAIYPYNEGHQQNGTSLTVNMPIEYGDFSTDYAANTHAIMFAAINEVQTTPVTNLEFKHLGGVLRFVIDNMPTGAAQFVFTATDKGVTGTFTADISGTDPVINAKSPVSSDNTVTIKFKPLAGATNNMTFYVPLPVGEYSGFSIAVKKQNGDDLASFTTTETNILSRKMLARIPKLRFVTVTGSLEWANAATYVADNDAVTAAFNQIKDETDPILDLNASSAVTTFNLPASFTSSSTINSVLNINYSETPSSDIIITENGYSEGANVNKSKGELNISIPEATSGSAPNVTIQTPTLTTGLYAAEDGKATYGNVTATTASNTLIVGDGVIINSLTIKGGNVRVKGNAEITALNKDSGLSGIVYIYKESDAAQLPTSIPEGFVVVDAAIADMKDVFANGGTYTLQKDLNIVGTDMTVASGVTATLDLNGHTITAANTQTGNIEVYGTLTIQDGTAGANGVGAGKIVTNSDYTGSASGYALVNATGENAKIIMESGCVYAVRDDAVNKGQFAMGVDAGGDFTMTGGKIEAGWYAVSGNGTNYTQNSVINVQGGELISTSDYAIYLPHSGETTISGGTVNGAAGAVSIQRGTLSISNGANIMSKGTGDTGEWGDGTGNQPNCAVMVAAKYGDCTINITGGNFSAEGDTILLGTGSTTYNVDMKISGGTFSDPSALAYLTDNADVTVKLTDNMVLNSSIVVPKATVTIDLANYTLTASATATEYNNKVTAIAVKDGAKATVKNGNIGNASTSMFYGVYAYGTADVTLENVDFSEMVTYAYNGKGKLSATDCIFKGWLSAWHYGGTFENCTFTIGKEWYPAAICYGSTTFTNCKFFKNNIDADIYDDSGNPDDDGYYRCNYVVAGCNPATTIDFVTCKFINENGVDTEEITSSNHPYHACGWGDGKIANAQIKVDGTEITSQCTDASKSQGE